MDRYSDRQTERQTDHSDPQRQTDRQITLTSATGPFSLTRLPFLLHYSFPRFSMWTKKNNHFSRSCFFCLTWCLEIPSTFEQVVWFHSWVNVNNTALVVNISFPHSSIDRYLDWFHNLGIINASPIHKDIQISLLHAYTDAAGLYCCIWVYTHYYMEW